MYTCEDFCCTRWVLRYHGERNRHHNEPFSRGTLAPQSVPLQEILFLDILDYWPRTGCHPVVGKKAPGCGDNRDERSCAGIGLLRRWRKFRWGRRRIDSRYPAGHLRSHPIGNEREHDAYYDDHPQGNLASRRANCGPYWSCCHLPRVSELVGWAGSQTRVSTPSREPWGPRICSFGRCRVVRLHYPPVWNSRRESNPDLFVRTELGPKRHHALDHASLTNVEGCSELNSDLILLGKTPR